MAAAKRTAACGEWVVTTYNGPMLSSWVCSSVARKVLASPFSADDEAHYWLVPGDAPPPPSACPCGSFNLQGLRAHLPEAVHSSYVEITLRGAVTLRFDAIGALRRWAALSATSTKHAVCDAARTDFWRASKEQQDGAPGTWDWSYETDYTGEVGGESVDRRIEKCTAVFKQPPLLQAKDVEDYFVEEAGECCSKEFLAAHWVDNPPVFRADVPLFEDTLHDHGISRLTAHVVVTAVSWFVQLRSVRVILGELATVRDTRYFGRAGSSRVRRLLTASEAPFSKRLQVRSLNLKTLAPLLESCDGWWTSHEVKKTREGTLDLDFKKTREGPLDLEAGCAVVAIAASSDEDLSCEICALAVDGSGGFSAAALVDDTVVLLLQNKRTVVSAPCELADLVFSGNRLFAVTPEGALYELVKEWKEVFKAPFEQQRQPGQIPHLAASPTKVAVGLGSSLRVLHGDGDCSSELSSAVVALAIEKDVVLVAIEGWVLVGELRYRTGKQAVTCLATRGDFLIAGCYAQALKVWNGRQLATAGGFQGPIVALQTAGVVVAAAAGTSCVLWRLPTAVEEPLARSRCAVCDHGDDIEGIALLDTRVATYAGCTVRVFGLSAFAADVEEDRRRPHHFLRPLCEIETADDVLKALWITNPQEAVLVALTADARCAVIWTSPADSQPSGLLKTEEEAEIIIQT